MLCTVRHTIYIESVAGEGERIMFLNEMIQNIILAIVVLSAKFKDGKEIYNGLAWSSPVMG